MLIIPQAPADGATLERLSVMSFIARYHAADGGTMLGGVRASSSSRFSHRADAETRLQSAIEINATVGRTVVGEVVESRQSAEIIRHCSDSAAAQALGAICPRCKLVVQTPTWCLYWSPEGKKIGVVVADTARAAVRKAPKPYRKYLGEIYAERLP